MGTGGDGGCEGGSEKGCIYRVVESVYKVDKRMIDFWSGRIYVGILFWVGGAFCDLATTGLAKGR